MRQKLNENPVAQIAVVAVLLLAVGVFLLKSMGGGDESEPAAEEPIAVVTPEEAVGSLEGSAPAAATSSIAAPASQRLPREVETAYEDGETVVLLIYRAGGIDDRLVATATTRSQRYARGRALRCPPSTRSPAMPEITGPLGVNAGAGPGRPAAAATERWRSGARHRRLRLSQCGRRPSGGHRRGLPRPRAAPTRPTECPTRAKCQTRTHHICARCPEPGTTGALAHDLDLPGADPDTPGLTHPARLRPQRPLRH